MTKGPDSIDPCILLMADALDRNVSDKDIVEAFSKNNISNDDIFLFLVAAKLLHNDRKTAPKIKPTFKRVV